MKGTRHTIPDLFCRILPLVRAIHTSQQDVLDMAFESGYGKGYEEPDTINDHYAALADGLADEARDGYFRGKADAESEKGEPDAI
jgi:hypothetical protein